MNLHNHSNQLHIPENSITEYAIARCVKRCVIYKPSLTITITPLETVICGSRPLVHLSVETSICCAMWITYHLGELNSDAPYCTMLNPHTSTLYPIVLRLLPCGILLYYNPPLFYSLSHIYLSGTGYLYI